MKRRLLSSGVGTDPRPLSRAFHGPGNPFGPFDDPRDVDKQRKAVAARRAIDDVIKNVNEGPFSIAGAGNFTLLCRVDTFDFTWGTLIVDSVVQNPAAVTTMDATVHAEIQILAYVSGVPFVWLQSAVGNHLDFAEPLSPGPLVLNILEGQMPDAVEVYARARRGGVAETSPATDEVLNLSVLGRLHR